MGNIAAAKRKTTRVRTPTVLQMQSTESGAAALAMVLAYYRRFVPLEELRVACGVSRDGTTTGNLVKGAARYGLAAHDSKCEVDDLPALSLPLVVGWGSNRFVVVEGFGKGRVYLNDPACGPTAVSDADFSEKFTGNVVTFVRGPDFKPGGHPQGLDPPAAPAAGGDGDWTALRRAGKSAPHIAGVGRPGLDRALCRSLPGRRAQRLGLSLARGDGY